MFTARCRESGYEKLISKIHHGFVSIVVVPEHDGGSLFLLLESWETWGFLGYMDALLLTVFCCLAIRVLNLHFISKGPR